jgi:glycosyltransferase involved in cell wall biosynthesis
MTILFVAFPFSIHTARWLSQLEGQGWNIHLFSSVDHARLNPEIRGVHYHENFFDMPASGSPGNKYSSVQLRELAFLGSSGAGILVRKAMTFTGKRKSRELQLKDVISRVKPDIIHSFETQHAGYLVNRAKEKFVGQFPYWIHTTWGIDLHFFGRLQAHVKPISDLMANVDLLLVEGKRDAILAAQFGYKHEMQTFSCAAGGFRPQAAPAAPPSSRQKILVKGTQDMVRRGTVALRALERCADLLGEYEIVLYSANEITRAAAELFYHSTGKKITIQKALTHEQMLHLNAAARISICTNISDGLPNAMLEAMYMGAFPIQSNTSIADEWIQHGVTGMIVPAEDPDIIEASVREALTKDELVDNAAVINMEKIRVHLNYEQVKTSVINMYHLAFKKTGK